MGLVDWSLGLDLQMAGDFIRDSHLEIFCLSVGSENDKKAVKAMKWLQKRYSCELE